MPRAYKAAIYSAVIAGILGTAVMSYFLFKEFVVNENVYSRLELRIRETDDENRRARDDLAAIIKETDRIVRAGKKTIDNIAATPNNPNEKLDE